MLNFKNKTAEDLGCSITLEEILQQPELWMESYSIYEDHKDELIRFIHSIPTDHKKLRIIFTGAGTSEYVGNIIYTYLNKREHAYYESIPTTSLVSSPQLYFRKEEPTLLVSFARSGNSPESLAAVDLANHFVENIYHLAITCASDGKLATKLSSAKNSYVWNMPPKSNDKGFAMTGSFSCMLLSALLLFDTISEEEKKENVEKMVSLGQEIIHREEEITRLSDFDFDRIVYLASGSLYPLMNECRLKILELTAGKVVTCNESSMGFRHGPKSFINAKTFVVSFLSNNDYTRKYDEDILAEIAGDQIAEKIVAISDKKDPDKTSSYEEFTLESVDYLQDEYLALPYVLIAQLIALITSIRVKNTPDTPSKTGTVNRVVKGVTIHSL